MCRGKQTTEYLQLYKNSIEYAHFPQCIMLVETPSLSESQQKHPLHVSHTMAMAMQRINITFLAGSRTEDEQEERDLATDQLRQSGMSDEAIEYYVQRWRTAMGVVNKPR